MSRKTYLPRRGDVMHVNFQPSAGTEFTGPHYAIVLSNSTFSRATGLCICVGLTTKFHGDLRLGGSLLMMKLPTIDGLKTEGWAYVHQVRAIDFRERGAALVSNLLTQDPDFLGDLMERVRGLIDLDDPTP